ncbi:hypothetical protein [Caulobacter zeae]|uniref:hypothetical protein n=1 Tax=Caulobacter zeae TaxID=2055137 RepID=UPI001055BFBD|nr:hypothetical protein [Caulobacter zeae]
MNVSHLFLMPTGAIFSADFLSAQDIIYMHRMGFQEKNDDGIRKVFLKILPAGCLYSNPGEDIADLRAEGERLLVSEYVISGVQIH